MIMQIELKILFIKEINDIKNKKIKENKSITKRNQQKGRGHG